MEKKTIITLDDPRVKESLLFPVDKIPAKELFGMPFDKRISHAIVAGSGKNRRVLHLASPSYHLSKNSDILLPLAAELKEAGYDYSINFIDQGGTAFFVDFILPKFEKSVSGKGKPDIIMPKLRIQNSYNGRVKYGYSFGFYRQVCSNGMSVPIGESKNITRMHTASLADGFEEILETLTGFIKDSGKIMKVYEDLVKKKVDKNNISQLIEEVADEVDFPPTRVEEAIERAEFEMNEIGLPPSEYIVYNALNYTLTHSDMKMKEHKKMALDQRVLTAILER